MLVLNFPSNPTGHCVELPFFERVVEIAKQHDLWVVHDLAYADLVFDGYQAPSILQVPVHEILPWNSSRFLRATTCRDGAWAFAAGIPS